MGRSVLVTGASGGIGGAVARAFADGGDRVALCAHSRPERAEALARQLRGEGREAISLAGDITNAAQVEEMFAAAEGAHGPAEVLVNAAGIARQKMFCDITEEEWDDMFAVHVKGSFLCSKRALPAMVREKAGSIVNIASMWGQVGASCEVDYSAAKAAVIGMTKALAKEVGPSGVRVNCVSPGAIETDMMADFSAADKAALCGETPLGRLGTPEEVAAAVVFLASPGAAFITGQVLAPNGGFVV